MGFPFACILHIVHFFTLQAKSDTAVDTALTAMVMLVVGVEDVDFVPQESSLSSRAGNERLFIAEF